MVPGEKSFMRRIAMYGKDGRWYTTRHRSVGKKIETYRFLVRYIGEMGHSPTVQEVADEMRVYLI